MTDLRTKGKKLVLALLCIACAWMGSGAQAQTLFQQEGDRVSGYAVSDDGIVTIRVDMPVPEAPETVPAFTVKSFPMTEKRLLQVLKGRSYDRLGEFEWQTSYEKSKDEERYEFFELHGQGGMTLSEFSTKCTGYRNTDSEEAMRAEAVLASILEELGLPVEEPFYFTARNTQATELLYTQGHPDMEFEKRRAAIMGRESEEETGTVIVARFPMGDWAMVADHWVFNPHKKDIRDQDRGGYVTAVIDDAGNVIHIALVNPVTVQEKEGETFACIGWEAALEEYMTRELDYVAAAQYLKRDYKIRDMELCYARADTGEAYPVWRISIEWGRTSYRPNGVDLHEELYASAAYVHAVTGEVLDYYLFVAK